VQIHDVNAMEGHSSSAHQLYRRLAIPRAADVADAVVTVSEFSKREIVSHLGIGPDKIRVVYNGVDEYFFEPGDGDPFDLPDSYVLYVGAINPRKNVERLVEAFNRLDGGPGIPEKLVLIGPERKAIFKAVDLEDSTAIVTPGYVTRAELKYAYTHADLFAFPSLYEGFGLPPLEAMACGTPVVAGEAGALPEVLGDAAEFVDPSDVDAIARGIQRVLTNQGCANDLVLRGSERVKKYTWEGAVDTLVNMLPVS
jgi:glycosyltransferase involved in cell wall biosynthesis